MRLALFAASVAATLLGALPATAQNVSGAGSTFAFPVLQSWSQAFQREQADAEFQPVGSGLDYEPIGSQAGMMRLRAGDVDFGTTDVPLGPEELKASGFTQFPIVIGGVVAAVNIPELKDRQLRLTGPLLADIYLGRIKTWSDPAIRDVNPDLPLPEKEIAVIGRQDGSGTTFNFTDYLSKVSSDWQAQVGRALLVKWPVGKAAKGNGGMADAVKNTAYAIGYVEFAQARRSGLAVAELKNSAGNFVAPSPQSFQAAAAGADWNAAQDFNLLLTNSGADTAYPIVATTFAVLSAKQPATARVRAAVAFFRWSATKGADKAAQLGYVPLPPQLVGQVETRWRTLLGEAAR